jgi:uncharacterized protein (TIGR02453 family)
MDLKKILDFLKDLQNNNNRDWFKENNERYQTAKSEFAVFIDSFIPQLKEFDDDINVNSSKECVFRIFRDIRFSKNKDPYKTNFGAYIAKGGRKSPYAGYYIHVEPGKSFAGGGIYMPQPPVLRSVRNEIYENIDLFKGILNDQIFKKYFKEIHGEKLNSAPRGFPKDFEDIELLKHKHYAVIHNVKDSFWNSKQVFEKLVDIFKAQYQFNQFLNTAVHKSK